MLRTRSRFTFSEPAILRTQDFFGPVSAGYVHFVNRETTVDEEHPWYAWREVVNNELSRGFTTGVEIGGDFTSVKTTCELLSKQPVSLRGFPHSGDYLYKFDGPLVPSLPQITVPLPEVKERSIQEFGQWGYGFDHARQSDPWIHPSQTDEELAVLGASLVSKLAPTAPHNSVYTSLGELRNDGLPSIPFLSFLKGGSIAKNAGGEYLNYQFGIAPTISDVKNILETVKKADKLWKQYLRDSGRLVRRRFDMDPEKETVTEILATEPWIIPVNTSSSHWSSVGPVTAVTEITRKRWFSAAYLYYVDKSSLAGMEGFLEKANYLYGWKPSPSATYNLTAWSWLLDWFTNTGDVIDNVSLYLEDPFLVRWAYIMEETSAVKTISQSLVSSQGQSVTASMRFTTHIKKRRRVNPFHLGFKGEALNGHQLAILAALGLTKGRNPGSM